jgi:hypothetical protein
LETHSGYKPEGRDRDQDDQYEQDRRDERRAEPRNRPARQAKTAAAADAATKDTASRTEPDGGAPSALGQDGASDTAPAAWVSAAKAEWKNLSPAVKQAVLKRESDVERGVSELRARYSDLDQALAPHMPTIRQFNHTPAQAVTQLFAWQMALHNDPKRFFPELMKNYGVGPLDIFPELAGGYAPQQQDAAQRSAAD